MEQKKVKSGKEILDDFFNEITTIPGVDQEIAKSLISLYEQGKLTDINVKNQLHTLRETDGN
jgi:hypothetical protein